MKDGSPFIVVSLLPARSAEPPHNSGSTGASAASTPPDALRVATPLSSGGKDGSASVQLSGSRGAASRSSSSRCCGCCSDHSPELLVPLRVRLLAPVGHLARVRDEVIGGGERDGRVEAEHLLGLGYFLGAERGAVRGPGVLRVRRWPRDDRAQRDEGRLGGVLPCGLESVVQRPHVLVVTLGCPPAQPLHVPPVGLVPCCDVLGLGDVGVVLDRDVVVVIEHDEVAELLVPGDSGGLVADAFLHVPVGHEAVDVVIERAGTGGGVRVEQAALAPGRHRHPDRVADALAERAGRGLHAAGVPVLRVPRRQAAPLPVVRYVVQSQAIAGQIQLDVESQA